MRAIIALAMLLAATGSARAAEINAMLTDRYGTAINELAPQFDRANGHAIHEVHGPSGGLVRRLNAGEPADVIFINDSGIDELIRQGKLVAWPHRPHAHRHRHCGAQGRTQTRHFHARRAQACAARRQIDRLHRPGRRRPHRRTDHRDDREIRHLRASRCRRPSSPPAVPTAASARSSPTAKPRSACRWFRSCCRIQTLR